MKHGWKALIGVGVLAAGIAPVLAQQPLTQAGDVTVDISDVRADIAKNLNVDVNTLPSTVQLPVGVAANVCNVAANTLAPGQQAAGQSAACKATTTNNQLEQAIRRETGSKK